MARAGTCCRSVRARLGTEVASRSVSRSDNSLDVVASCSALAAGTCGVFIAVEMALLVLLGASAPAPLVAAGPWTRRPFDGRARRERGVQLASPTLRDRKSTRLNSSHE